MFVSDIEKLGMTEKESKIYLTSLRVGPASMQVLARKAKIDRGTAYHVAMTLGEKGLFGIVSPGKRPTFGVRDPQVLFTYVEERKREADAHFVTVQGMIDDLKDLYQSGFTEGA